MQSGREDGATSAAEDLLRHVGFVRLLPASLQPLVRALFRPVSFVAGAVIIDEGSEADALFVLASGTARVVKGTGDDRVELDELVPPAVFGEVGLLSGDRRLATIRAATAVETLRLGRDGFEALMQVHPEVADALAGHVRLSRINTLLRGHPAFSILPTDVLVDSLADFEPVELDLDESITETIDEDDAALYVVESGRVRLSVLDGDHFVERAILHPGDFFGEASVLQGTPWLERVEALEPSRLFRLDVAAFADLVGRDAAFRRMMSERSRLRDLGLTTTTGPGRRSTRDAPLVEIDEASRDDAVAGIIESEFFADLSARAASLRRKVRSQEIHD